MGLLVTKSIRLSLKPHLNAFNKPKSEIILCSKILQLIRAEYDEVIEQNVDGKIMNHPFVDILTSRVLHVQGRLQRISHSKSNKPSS